MEKQQQYNRTITFTGLAKYILSTYCMPKIMRDVDKPDPMTETFPDLKEMFRVETDERNKAFRIWEGNKMDRNANALLEEIADQINILLFEAGKVAGYHVMERK